jgi:predicted hotdog family 3-hydroxylacyl-ACP dehydratase
MNADVANEKTQLKETGSPETALTPITKEDAEKLLTGLASLLNGATGAGVYSLVLRDDGPEAEFIAVTLRLTTLGDFPDRTEEFFLAKLKEEVGDFLLENDMSPPDNNDNDNNDNDDGGDGARTDDDEDYGITQMKAEVKKSRMGTAEELVANVREQIGNAFGVVIYSFVVVSHGDTVKDIDHAEARFYVFGSVPFPCIELFVTKAESYFLPLFSSDDEDAGVPPQA